MLKLCKTHSNHTHKAQLLTALQRCYRHRNYIRESTAWTTVVTPKHQKYESPQSRPPSPDNKPLKRTTIKTPNKTQEQTTQSRDSQREQGQRERLLFEQGRSRSGAGRLLFGGAGPERRGREIPNRRPTPVNASTD